jgi:toxin ParE1/3/4
VTAGAAWTVDLTEPAEADFTAIITWTAEQFGNIQARVYADTLRAALIALRDGPDTPGVKRRDEIGKDLCTLHIARDKRRGRHFILFRVRREALPPRIEVLRILHDAMDLARHLPDSNGGPRV